MAAAEFYKVTLPNLLMFQGVWWSNILQYESIAAGVLVVMLVHFLATRSRYHSDQQITGQQGVGVDVWLLPVVGLGLLTDFLMYQIGAYRFPEGQFPLWLVMMWIAFTLTITRSLVSFLQRANIWILLCILFGPLAYFGGQYYQRLVIADWAFILMAIQWGGLGYVVHWLLADKLATHAVSGTAPESVSHPADTTIHKEAD